MKKKKLLNELNRMSNVVQSDLQNFFSDLRFLIFGLQSMKNEKVIIKVLGSLALPIF